MKKKLFLLALVVVMVASVFAGCTQETAQETPAATKSTEKAEEPKEPEVKEETKVVTAMMMQSRNTEGFQMMVKKLEDEANIKLDVQIIPDDQYDNLLQLKLSTGEAPDLLDYNVPQLFGAVDAETKLADLTDQAWTGSLKSAGLVTYNDKIYAFPFSELAGFQAIVYNEKVFQDNNIAIPTDWAGVLAAAETIKAAGVTPFFVPKDLWVPQIWMTAGYSRALGPDGAKAFADNMLGNKEKWTDHPELAQVIDTYLEVHSKGFVNEDYLTASIDKGYSQLAEGKVAMLFGATGMANALLETYPGSPINMMNPKMPFETDHYLSAAKYSISFSVNKDTENLDTIAEIFNLWSTPEYCDLYYSIRPGFPAFDGVDGGELPGYMIDLKTDFVDKGMTVSEMNAMITPVKTLLNSSLWIYYADAPAKGMTGTDILTKFQEDCEKLLTENAYPGWE